MATRCGWAEGGGDLLLEYHDREWGVPSHDDRHLFEILILEGAQAGLSWTTILNKREGYRRAFAKFDASKVARFDDARRSALLADAGIVRNRAKIEAAVNNAGRVLEARKEFGSLDAYVWRFVDGATRIRRSRAPAPAETAESRELSKDLRRRGFRFVGPTICYAFMQSVGMVNDHETTCFRHDEL
jgi:DNA-3-methyladenine glycosylase I